MQVVIAGDNFITTPTFPTARLGTIDISITGATTNTLTATVPAGLPLGVYALIVWNPDGCPGSLSPAYTVLSPVTTLETGYVATFGPAAPGTEGDDDHVQEIFFHVPASYTGTLSIWIFDADTDGANDEQHGGSWNTTIQYTLNGSGVSTQTVIGPDPTAIYHGQWVPVFGPYLASDLVDGSGVFRLVVNGVSGDDGNIYNVALSTNSLTNTPPGGSRIFAYVWTFPIFPGLSRWLYPYVPPGTTSFEQHNFDMMEPGSVTTMELYTPIRVFPDTATAISGDGVWDSSSHPVATLEDGVTWAVRIESTLAGWNNATFRADGDGAALAIFTLPTTSPPP